MSPRAEGPRLLEGDVALGTDRERPVGRNDAAAQPAPPLGSVAPSSPPADPAAEPDSPPPSHLPDDRALLRAVAQFAAGAAHELNNPLTVISGRAQLMREKARDGEERAVWDSIREHSERISNIITELMCFASPSTPQPKNVNLGKAIHSALSYFSEKNPPNASPLRCDICIEAGCPTVWMDPDQLEAVLIELLRNARTASRDDAADIRISAGEGPNGQVLLRIRDFGCGMDSETLSDAFTPFFSRRPAGRGRGLGLPMAWRYVVNNRGRLWLQSQPNEGTTACVLLPTSAESIAVQEVDHGLRTQSTHPDRG